LLVVLVLVAVGHHQVAQISKQTLDSLLLALLVGECAGR
jgi:hypothetical protein